MLGHKAVGIHADHVGIAKFASEESHGYVRICGELKRWVEDLKIPKDDNNKAKTLPISEVYNIALSVLRYSLLTG